MSSPTAARVSVCAATFRRPVGLERLLRALDRLEFRAAPRPDLEIVVVDNDPDGSARATCDRLRAELRWALRYVHEARRGISHARNRACAEAASRGSQWLAFIDDDEIPEPQWLDQLLAVATAHGADLVAGPVVPQFEADAPDWARSGGFFDLKRYATGERIEHAGTGNVLLRVGALAEMGPEPFDPRMALSGGEDTLFFLRFARAGRVMVWADEAMAYETIPPTRTRRDWVLKRAFRKGSTWSVCERELQPGARVAASRAAKGMVRIAQGMALLPAAVLRGRPATLRALEYVYVGAGNLAGLVGVQYQEYRTTHGQ